MNQQQTLEWLRDIIIENDGALPTEQQWSMITIKVLTATAPENVANVEETLTNTKEDDIISKVTRDFDPNKIQISKNPVINSFLTTLAQSPHLKNRLQEEVIDRVIDTGFDLFMKAKESIKETVRDIESTEHPNGETIRPEDIEIALRKYTSNGIDPEENLEELIQVLQGIGYNVDETNVVQFMENYKNNTRNIYDTTNSPGESKDT